jgi:hypothetical protein
MSRIEGHAGRDDRVDAVEDLPVEHDVRAGAPTSNLDEEDAPVPVGD